MVRGNLSIYSPGEYTTKKEGWNGECVHMECSVQVYCSHAVDPV